MRPTAINAPSSARKGDLRGGLNWRRSRSVLPRGQANTKTAGTPKPSNSPGRKQRGMGFAQAAGRPGVAVQVKQEEEQEDKEVSSDIDNLGDLDPGVGDGHKEAVIHGDKAIAPKDGALAKSSGGKSKSSTSIIPNRPSSCVPIEPTQTHSSPSATTEKELSTNGAGPLPSLPISASSPQESGPPTQVPTQVSIELLSASTTRSSEAYILTITLPAQSDLTSTINSHPQSLAQLFTSQLAITPIPNTWLRRSPPPPPLPKNHKSTNDNGKPATADIPQTTLSLYCIPYVLYTLYKLGRLTETDLLVIRKAVMAFTEVIKRRYGAAVAGGRQGWGLCAFGPKMAGSGGFGVKIEVVVRRVKEEWLVHE
ncbi:hypothetical protein BGX38DRAFT_1276523 [Terfezia claveryi]|nr:hypothetical protein BGX38DRAFT_1276523 [Terfezia claveryi]